MFTDGSNKAKGTVLSQDGKPVCYASRILNGHEKSYSTIEKELLAIVWSVKYLCPYLYVRKFLLSLSRIELYHNAVKSVRSAEEDTNENFYTSDKILNKYKTQVLKNKDKAVEIPYRKYKIIYVIENYISN